MIGHRIAITWAWFAPASGLRIRLRDALDLCFAARFFDTAVSFCTVCAVPDPALALDEMYRVLWPGGQLPMFEHVRSRNAVLGLALDAMTVFTRRSGTEMNRDTLAAVARAGCQITRVDGVFLDVSLAVRAANPWARAA